MAGEVSARGVDEISKLRLFAVVVTVMVFSSAFIFTSAAAAEQSFRNSYWRCYDGIESNEGGPTSCKSSDTWRIYAEEFCAGHCSTPSTDGTTKCGVTHFSVSNECSEAATQCPATIGVSSDKKTAYLQGETAVFTITMRDAAGNIVKRGASLSITSAIETGLKYGKAFPATDSGVVTVEVPLTAATYPPAAYAVQVSSEAGDCSPVSGGQSLAVEGTTEEVSKPSCKTLGTLMYTVSDGTGYIGCDVEVSGEFDLAKSYCISQKTYQKRNLVPDAYQRPNRYFNTLKNLDPNEAVKVFIVSNSGEEIECLPPLNLQETVKPKQPSCTDSDGGQNRYVKGTASHSTAGSASDFCSTYLGSSHVFEYYCIDSSSMSSVYLPCESGCGDGACLEAATIASCKDSEQYANYYERGTVYGNLDSFGDGYQGVTGEVHDFCIQLGSNGEYPWVNEPSGNNVYNRHEVYSCQQNCAIYEIYCKGSQVWTEVPTCPGSCVNGACLSSTAVQPAGYCPSRIELFTDKDAYRAGEEGKLTVRTYNDDGQLQGYDLVVQYYEANALQSESSQISTMPSGVYESSGNVGQKHGVYTFTFRQQPSCDDSGKVVSASKTISVVSAEEAPPVVPEGKYVYELQVRKGWNLVSLLPLIAVAGKMGSSSTTCSWLQDGLSSGSAGESYVKKNMFSYDSTNKKYVSLGEFENLPSPAPNGYLVNSPYNGFWLRSTQDCSVTMDFSSATSNNDLFKTLDKISNSNYKLVKGWNFFAVWPETEGKTLDDIKGSCEIKKAYAYDQLSRKWTNLEGIEFSHSAVGYGFVVKVADDCVLGESSLIGLPPPLPE